MYSLNLCTSVDLMPEIVFPSQALGGVEYEIPHKTMSLKFMIFS